MAKPKSKKAVKSANKSPGELTQSLNLVLADTYALMAATHAFHWNVEGTAFFSLHEAFQQQYEDLFVAADAIAEQVRQIGDYAVGGLRTLADLARIDEPSAPMDSKDMVAALVTAHEKWIRDAKRARDLSAEAGNTQTEDLMVERLRVHEKTLWMLRSYLK